jgi:hypothetical protein
MSTDHESGKVIRVPQHSPVPTLPPPRGRVVVVPPGKSQMDVSQPRHESTDAVPSVTDHPTPQHIPLSPILQGSSSGHQHTKIGTSADESQCKTTCAKGRAELGYLPSFESGRSYGFLREALQEDSAKESTYFRIRDVTDGNLRQDLRGFVPPTQVLFYFVEDGPKGPHATRVQYYRAERFAPHAETYCGRMLEHLNANSREYRRYSAEILEIWFGILRSCGKLGVPEMSSLLTSPFAWCEANVRILAPYLSNEDRLQLQRQLGLGSIWEDEAEMPRWVENVTPILHSQEEFTDLKNRRQHLLDEKKRRDHEEKEQQVRAKEETERAQLETLLLHYRSNPAGIRLKDPLRDVCLECGTSLSGEDIKWNDRKCPSCKKSWYSSHSRCSCRDGRVDSRDPDNPRCSDCQWLRCAECGACKDGCRTNP